MDISEGTGLALDGVHDRGPAVPHVDDDGAAGRVEIGPAIRVPDGAALGPGRHRQLLADDPLEDPAASAAASVTPPLLPATLMRWIVGRSGGNSFRQQVDAPGYGTKCVSVADSYEPRPQETTP